MTLFDVGPLPALVWRRHAAHERTPTWLSEADDYPAAFALTFQTSPAMLDRTFPLRYPDLEVVVV